jgi:hypothetical protein
MIIVRLEGGLGNQMFQYAAGRALAARHGVQLKLDLASLLDRTPRSTPYTFRNYDLDVFTLHAEFATPADVSVFNCFYKPGSVLSYASRAWKRIFGSRGAEQGYQYNAQFDSFGPDTYLSGNWQSPKYFSRIESEIRADFTFLPMAPNIQTLADEIAQPGSVCLHVRRGDYVGNSSHETVGLDYYTKAVALLAEKTQVRALYVFSDDIAWCREHLMLGYPTTYVGDEYQGFKASGNTYLMSRCSHFVIPNSTFSWWAAWLSPNPQKIVIAPKAWFPDASIDTSDLIPQDWIRI